MAFVFSWWYIVIAVLIVAIVVLTVVLLKMDKKDRQLIKDFVGSANPAEQQEEDGEQPNDNEKQSQ